MYEQITADNPYKTPMRIYPAVHYTMGGLWVDYNLQTTVPGLYACGEANFSDHGANRLGASALMQGLGGWILCACRTPLATTSRMTSGQGRSRRKHLSLRRQKKRCLIACQAANGKGKTPVDDFHRRLGRIMWNQCGMSRNAKGLTQAIADIQALREEFEKDVCVPDGGDRYNPELDKAGSVCQTCWSSES